MSLNNHKAAQFMGRSGSFSTRGGRNGANLLGWGEDEQLTLEQKRDCLVNVRKNIEAELMLLPKKAAQREPLVCRKVEIEVMLKDINAQLRLENQFRDRMDVGSIMLQMVKETMTKVQWVSLVNRAKAQKIAATEEFEAEKARLSAGRQEA